MAIARLFNGIYEVLLEGKLALTIGPLSEHSAFFSLFSLKVQLGIEMLGNKAVEFIGRALKLG